MRIRKALETLGLLWKDLLSAFVNVVIFFGSLLILFGVLSFWPFSVFYDLENIDCGALRHEAGQLAQELARDGVDSIRLTNEMLARYPSLAKLSPRNVDVETTRYEFRSTDFFGKKSFLLECERTRGGIGPFVMDRIVIYPDVTEDSDIAREVDRMNDWGKNVRELCLGIYYFRTFSTK